MFITTYSGAIKLKAVAKKKEKNNVTDLPKPCLANEGSQLIVAQMLVTLLDIPLP